MTNSPDAAIVDFVADQMRLIDLERRAEIDESHRLLTELTAKELERRGRCLLGLEARGTFVGLGGRFHVELHPVDSEHLPAHRMQSGDVVTMTQGSGPPDLDASGDAPLGVIAKVRDDRLVVALDSEPERPLEGRLRLDRVANDVTYRRLREALERLLNYESGRAKRLRNVAFGLVEPRFDANPPAVDVDDELNASQREAVAFALAAPDLALIHGPPGTGKTTAVAALIRAACRRRERVLACAPSNVAVDNLAEKLTDSGLSLVRLGHPARLLPAVVSNSLDAHIERSEATQFIKELRRDLELALKRLRRARGYGDRREMREDVRQLRRGIREFERETVRQILLNADVVLTTNTGAGARQLEGYEFDLLVIDEAAQALESSCWIPLLKSRRLVLAGDHRQLPPTIRSVEAARGGLEVTLFERMVADHPQLRRLLTTQYRMHETIQNWSSVGLYDGKLTAHESVRSHRLCDLPHVVETDATTTVLLFIDTAGFDAVESTDPHEESRWNDGEVELVHTHVEALLESGLRGDEIAVIAPYNAQVDRLRRCFVDSAPGLEIDTVDGFQGREKEAVVLSLVRSNERGEVGFLADRRRLNVAVTRARRHLAVVADSATIAHDPFLSGLVDYLQEHGTYRSAYEI